MLENRKCKDIEVRLVDQKKFEFLNNCKIIIHLMFEEEGGFKEISLYIIKGQEMAHVKRRAASTAHRQNSLSVGASKKDI